MNSAIVTSFLSLLFVALAQTSVMSAVNLPDILKAAQGEARGFVGEPSFERIGIDSRTTKSGDLFWAIRGERYDGHDFIADAFSRGAAAAVVSSDRSQTCTGPAIIVPDTLIALWDYSSWHRSQRDAVVIAVTGSFGKTTTREMIFSALQAGHCGTRSPRNYNNHVGVPLSLLEIAEHHEFAVVELGASAPGEIRDLAHLAAPEIGVVTGIGAAHLDGFGDLDGVIAAKSELLQALPACGFAVLNGDDPVARQMATRAACPVIFVGEREDNDVAACGIELRNGFVRFRVDGDRYELPVIGRHHVPAALAAIAIGREIGLSPAVIAGGLAGYQPVAGRCLRLRIGEWTVIDDTYNSNPASMQAACDVLRDWPPLFVRGNRGRRILVTGDMRELGTEAIHSHREAGRRAAESNIDHVIAHGEFARHLVDGALEAGMDAGRLADCGSLESLIAVLDCWLEPGDVVLVKGSRAMRMERVIEWMKRKAEEISQEKTARTPVRACA